MRVDVHCHLNHKRFSEDIKEVVERARAAGVKRVICAGTNPVTNRQVHELAKKYDILRCSFGAYPHDVIGGTDFGDEEPGLTVESPFDLDKEIARWKTMPEAFIAVGEIGMDFSHGRDSEEVQRENFRKVLAAAHELGKPVVVHTRQAERECIEELKNSALDNNKIVLHCFGGRKSIIKDAASAGMNFSVPAVIARLQHFETLVSLVPMNQLLTETDSPWLSPVKDVRNEPANVVTTIKHIARLKGFEETEVMQNIFLNYQRIFGTD
jgi:TatD DNase family protein